MEKLSTNHTPEVLPRDEYNTTLVANVHPPQWKNPDPAPRYNLVVIGAGTAGLVTAAGAAGLGAKVALIERHLMGGDCLNVGCVPSKCVIRSSRVKGDLATAAELGVHIPPGTTVDFSAAMARMRRVRARISYHDSAFRFSEQLGVDVFLGEGRFAGLDTIEVDGKTLRFKRAVIATGSRASHPPIPGLIEVGFLTNETIFSLTEQPRRLAVIGGGPIGCELAQAFRRFGSTVVLFDTASHLLPREDSDAAAMVQQAFTNEGIHLRLESRLTRVERTAEGKILFFEAQGHSSTVAVDEILVGAGRLPNIEGLNLAAAGVHYDDQKGVAVNDCLQTSNARIYA